MHAVQICSVHVGDQPVPNAEAVVTVGIADRPLLEHLFFDGQLVDERGGETGKDEERSAIPEAGSRQLGRRTGSQVTHARE